MITVPFFDLKRQYHSLRNEVLQAMGEVMEKTAFSGGEFVGVFEKQFARYIGTKHAVALNSGTSALHLALLALGVGPGDEVIVPAHTFIASAWGVSYVGAKPVFVDCDKDTWEIDPRSVEKVITKKTKAIICVHLYGVPCDIIALRKIARKHKLYLVEDCAQAHGAKHKKKSVGTFGDIGAFSFYPSKNLGAYGEGGAIVTDSKKLADRVAILRSHGGKEKYSHEMIGYNMRMDGLQAAVLSIKLRHLDDWNKRKTAIVNAYRAGIKNPAITLQTVPKGNSPAHHLFVVVVGDRAAFVKHLLGCGIGTALHYPVPCHLQKAYRHLGYTKGDIPHAEFVASHCVSLPLFPEMTDEEVGRVIRAVNSYE